MSLCSVRCCSWGAINAPHPGAAPLHGAYAPAEPVALGSRPDSRLRMFRRLPNNLQCGDILENVVLTAGLILLIRWSPRLREALFNPAIQWMVAALASLYILIVSLYGYNAQPMADFRSYPVGTQLAVASDDSEASDETDSYTFIYEKRVYSANSPSTPFPTTPGHSSTASRRHPPSAKRQVRKIR